MDGHVEQKIVNELKAFCLLLFDIEKIIVGFLGALVGTGVRIIGALIAFIAALPVLLIRGFIFLFLFGAGMSIIILAVTAIVEHF